MKDRFPRTAREFADHGRLVMVRCDQCGSQRPVDAELLVFTFGDDFDLYDGMAELRSQLCCSACGAGRPALFFRKLNEEPFGEISFEQSVINSLEANAFARATDTGPQRPRGRVRKFGRGR